jgi:hypothetical protein
MQNRQFCLAFGNHLLDELEAVIGENLYENHPDLLNVHEHMLSTEALMIGFLYRNPSEEIIAQIERMQKLRKQVRDLMTDVTAM